MQVLITAAALEQFTKLPRPILLSGDLSGHFRLRTGDYRVQFSIENNSIIVEQMGHRDGFYDQQSN